MKWDEAELAQVMAANPDLARVNEEIAGTEEAPLDQQRLTNKYHAQRMGHYASKKEAEYATQLALRKQAGEISFWVEQVPLQLDGLTNKGRPHVYRLDFAVFRPGPIAYTVPASGVEQPYWQIDWVEVKGYRAPLGELKRHEAEAKYGIKITVV